MKKSVWYRKSYGWVTLALFLISLAAHWMFGWQAFQQEEIQHGSTPVFADFAIQAMRDTMENWQSEFLQLIWQVAGLSFLFYTGSPSSKEGDERKEEKLDYIIKHLTPDQAQAVLSELERKYPKG
jgi:hypothetical protein